MESFLTVAILGLVAGFVFSIPVAGPISILLISKALNGRLRYCLRLSLGAAIVELFYVFIAIYGITQLYETYKSFIPFLLLGGSAFLLYVGIKVIKTKLDLKAIKRKELPKDILLDKGGLRTGLLINITNPSLFLGWLTSSFLLFSFASSVNLNTGGLDLIVNENVQQISEMTEIEFQSFNDPNIKLNDDPDTNESNGAFSIFLGLVYAFTVAVGSYFWLTLLSKLVVKHRGRLNLKFLNKLIQFLGVCLIGIALYLIYQAIILL